MFYCNAEHSDISQGSSHVSCYLFILSLLITILLCTCFNTVFFSHTTLSAPLPMHSFLVTSVSIVQTGYPIMVALIDVWNSAIVFYLSRLYTGWIWPYSWNLWTLFWLFVVRNDVLMACQSIRSNLSYLDVFYLLFCWHWS